VGGQMQASLTGVRERELSQGFFGAGDRGQLQIAPQRWNVEASPALPEGPTALIARIPLQLSPIAARSGLAILAVLGAAVLAAGWSVNSAPRPAPAPDETAAAQSAPQEESVAPTSPRPGQLAAARELAKFLTLSAYPIAGPDWSEVAALVPPVEAAARDADPAPAKKSESRTAGASERAASTKQSAAVFNDRQLISIRDRLKLTPDQARYWPAVEEALRALTWRHQRGRPGVSDGTLEPNSVQGLVSAATPLVLTLREEQKREVRTLAHLVGLEQLASQF
jgi:hypothetical protein